MVDCEAAMISSHLVHRHTLCFNREAANIRVVTQLAKNIAQKAKLLFELDLDGLRQSRWGS